MKAITMILFVVIFSMSGFSAQPTGLAGFFREGQTFLTWQEDGGQSGEKYRIYRSHSQISNVGSAVLIAEINEGSSYFKEMHVCNGDLREPLACYIDHYIIQPVETGTGTQLSATTGLFVNTVKNTSIENAYYAVTTVSSGGVEETAVSSGNSIGPVSEIKQPIGAVRYSVDGTKDYYILWMDYDLWKESFTGYATPFAITRASFSNGGTMPSTHLDGIGTHFPGAGYSNYGNMDFSGNGQPTWYFGYHMSPNYDPQCNADAGKSMADTVANYVMYKHMQAVLWARRHYNITEPKFFINGNSMGASGSYGFLMAYPSFVTGIYCNEGLTQYVMPGEGSTATDTMWSASIYSNYGHYAYANPVKFLPFNDPGYPDLDWITQFNGMNVYDARNVVDFLKANTGVSFGYIGSGHGGSDGSIQYEYNGEHFEAYIKNSRHTFSYHYCATCSHNWQDISENNDGNGGMASRMRWNESRPGFSNVPARPIYTYNNYTAGEKVGDRGYLLDVFWGCIDRSFGSKRIEETDTLWSIPLYGLIRNLPTGVDFNKPSTVFSYDYENYTVDITPRNIQTLTVNAGDTFSYSITDTSGTTTIASGEAVADSLDLLLIPSVPVRQQGVIAKLVLKSRIVAPAGKTRQKIISRQSCIDLSPNPFNPSTSITVSAAGTYSVRTEGKILVTNLQGKKVWEHGIPARMIGSYTVAWNGTDVSGKSQGAGIYVVSVKIDDRLLVKKVVLTK